MTAAISIVSKGMIFCLEPEPPLLREFDVITNELYSPSSNVPFEVNIQAVLAFRSIGRGFTAIREWCGIMNMPYHLSKDGYTSSHERLDSTSKSSFKDIQ